MANHHGSEGQVFVSANQVAEVNSWEIQAQAEFADDTTLADTAKTFNATGITSWNGSMDCWFDETDTTGQQALTVGASVTLNLRAEGTGSGKHQYSGTALITNVTHGVPKGGIQTRSISFQGTGALSTANQA